MRNISNNYFRFCLVNLYVLFVFFLFSGLVIVQNKKFSIKPGSTITAEAKADKINNYEANMVNESDSSLEIEWKLLENTLMKGWDYSICNYGKCLAGIPVSGKMKTIKKGEKGFINLHVNPFKIKGVGKVSFYVYESGNESNGDTLTYIIAVK